MLNSILTLIQGKKTYIISVLMIVFAISGLVTGQIDNEQAIALILNALGLSALRAGVASK